jgi:hypothetical protein
MGFKNPLMIKSMIFLIKNCSKWALNSKSKNVYS